MFDTLYKLTSLINRVGLEDIVEESDLDDESCNKNKSCLNESENKKTNQDGEIIKLDADENEFNAARVLKRALNAHNWKLRTEEHDCHELFHLIMSVLDDELNEKIRSHKSLNFFQQQHQNLPNRLRSNNDSVGLPPLVVPHNPFHGYLAIQLQCLDCNYKVWHVLIFFQNFLSAYKYPILHLT